MHKIDHYILSFDIDNGIAERADKKLQKYNLTISDDFLKFLYYCSKHKDYFGECLKEEKDQPLLIRNYQEIPVYDNETDEEARERFRKEQSNDAGH